MAEAERKREEALRMKPLYDQATIWATLRRGVDNGYWTVDDLDQPSARALRETLQNT